MKKTNFIYKLQMLFVFLAMTVFSSCSGSSGESQNGEPKNEAKGEARGEVTISLTDAEGDFVTYSVDVVSITLTLKDGSVVETLPIATTVDFAQYVDITEFLTSASVPLGVYSKATMILDYSDADIRVENNEGEIVTAASILDGDGNAVTQLEVSVYLENQSALVITPGLIPHLSLDFDLKASNTISFDEAGNASVMVEPTLLADIDRESPNPHRARGFLGDIDENMSYFYVKLCPFFHDLKGKRTQFGQAMVLSGAGTVYEINGVDYVGDKGLAAMTGIDEDTAVLVKGKILINPCRIEAEEVYVGTSVPSVQGDVVMGSVLRRDGNTLAVNGLVCSQDGKEFRWNDTVSVTISENTLVKKQRSTEKFSIDDISPGQNIWVTGTLSMTESESLALDTTEGTARLLMTTLRGNVTSDNEDSALSIELDTMDLRKAALFDFTGTGTTPAKDADPLNYEIETGDLDTSSFGLHESIKVYGFVNAFGQAPYDFTATSLTNYSSLPSFLTLRWDPSTTEPFVEMIEESLVIDMDTENMHHLLYKSHQYQSDNDGNFAIKPSDRGVFIIQMRKNTHVYTDFTKFVNELEPLIDGYNRVRRLFAAGTYERNTQTLTTYYLTVELK